MGFHHTPIYKPVKKPLVPAGLSHLQWPHVLYVSPHGPESWWGFQIFVSWLKVSSLDLYFHSSSYPKALVIKKCVWVWYFPLLAGTAGPSDLKRVFNLTAAYWQLQAGPRRPRRTVAFGSWTSWLCWNRFKACVVLSHPSLSSETPLPALPSYQALFFAKCFHICYLISSNNSVR